MWTIEIYDIASDLSIDALDEFRIMTREDLIFLDYSQENFIHIMNVYLIYFGSKYRVNDVQIDEINNCYSWNVIEEGMRAS